MASSPAAIRPATLIDSRVLLDVITGDEQWAGWSAAQIATAMDAGRVVINPLIYAEVSVGYQTIEELEDPLPASDYERATALPRGLRRREGLRPLPVRLTGTVTVTGPSG